MTQNRIEQRRVGFTMIEVTVALALLAVAGAIVAQSLVWSLRERQRSAMHHAAIEIASNALETARAVPIEQLNQTWADAQTIPSEVAGTLPRGKLLVKVEPIEGAVQVKRVTAEVRWQEGEGEGVSPRSVSFVTLLSGRTGLKKGGQP